MNRIITCKIIFLCYFKAGSRIANTFLANELKLLLIVWSWSKYIDWPFIQTLVLRRVFCFLGNIFKSHLGFINFLNHLYKILKGLRTSQFLFLIKSWHLTRLEQEQNVENNKQNLIIKNMLVCTFGFEGNNYFFAI